MKKYKFTARKIDVASGEVKPDELRTMVIEKWEFTSIDGKEVAGVCENCDLPIMGDDKYYMDDEGTKWHKNCDNRIIQ